MEVSLPPRFYDISGCHGRDTPIVPAGYLMRIRIEELVKMRDGELGLRRATHVAALIEVVYLSYQKAFSTGLFYSDLKDQVDHKLATANLKPQEQHFRDIGWWQSLNRSEAREELRSNLERLIADPLTLCLLIGIELHVLFDIMMRTQYNEYESVIDENIVGRSPTLRASMRVLRIVLDPTSAAA